MFNRTLNGAILDFFDLKEKDRVINLFSEEEGKIKVIARGIKKITSKKAPYLDRMGLVSMSVQKGSTFDSVVEVKNNYVFKSIRLNYRKSIFINLIAEVLVKFLEEKICVPYLYRELYKTIVLIDHTDKEMLISSCFLAKFINLMGYYPELDLCVKCKTKLVKENAFFSRKYEGIICKKCIEQRKFEKNELSADQIKLLRLFINQEAELITKVMIKEAILRPVFVLLVDVIEYHYQKEIKTRDVVLDWLNYVNYDSIL